MIYICLKSLKGRLWAVARFPRFIQVRPDSLQIDFNLSTGKDTKRFVTVNWLKPGVDILGSFLMFIVFMWSLASKVLVLVAEGRIGYTSHSHNHSHSKYIRVNVWTPSSSPSPSPFSSPRHGHSHSQSHTLTDSHTNAVKVLYSHGHGQGYGHGHSQTKTNK